MTPQSIKSAVEGFLAHKRALGRKYRSEEHELRLLVRFAAERCVASLDELTPALLDDFLASRPRARPRSFNHLLGVVSCLFEWAVSWQLLKTSPPLPRRRRVTAHRIPFIFDVVHARRLLDAAADLPDNPRASQRGSTYHAVFALCYGLGLRVGEASRLRLGNVDLDRDLLVVVGGKFGKSRLVPFGPRIGRLLEAQVERRRAKAPSWDSTTPLFSFDGRNCINPGTATQTFHRLVATLDLPIKDGVSPPRLHDLRHSFAVGCLLRWYRQGLDPSTRLYHLSTFMGHVSPTSTAVYLNVTPALLEQGNRRFEAFAEPAWQEAAR